MIERGLYMKATGVVRRIDDLGRIVIPKEIRRNFKINDGDSLEIFVDSAGIVLKKYSLLDNMVKNATILVDSVAKVYQKNILITDREKIIAVSKEFQKQVLNKELSNNIKEKIDNDSNSYIVVDETNNTPSFLVPILVDSDSLGSVILINDEITDDDKVLVRLIASILVKIVDDSV
jgi:AbrB family transcriptional regulator (stage V sporulation protein T)